MKVYHFIDFPGFGTVHKLINDLAKHYSNNIAIMPINDKPLIDNALIKKINKENCIVVIHSSGRLDSYYLHNYKKLFKNRRIFMFMHVSPKYLKVKKRHKMFYYLREFVEKYNGWILTPSKEVTSEYNKIAIRAKTVQMGIDNIQTKKEYYEYNPALSQFYNRIITTCTSDETIYRKIKGIDRFEKLLKGLGVLNLGLICGNENINNLNIECKKFKSDDFLNILQHSIAYVQLSRLETYNLTAIQAKRFKVPALLLKTEGTTSCMGKDVCKSIKEIKIQLKRLLLKRKNTLKIENLFEDSLKRETLERFNNDLISL